MTETTGKTIIALDFDGVLHKYSREWHDGTIYDDPCDDAQTALDYLYPRYELIIFTCRVPIEDVQAWVKEKFGYDIQVTNGKPHADVYIDDRGMHHQDWQSTMAKLAVRGF